MVNKNRLDMLCFNTSVNHSEISRKRWRWIGPLIKDQWGDPFRGIYIRVTGGTGNSGTQLYCRDLQKNLQTEKLVQNIINKEMHQ